MKCNKDTLKITEIDNNVMALSYFAWEFKSKVIFILTFGR